MILFKFQNVQKIATYENRQNRNVKKLIRTFDGADLILKFGLNPGLSFCFGSMTIVSFFLNISFIFLSPFDNLI